MISQRAEVSWKFHVPLLPAYVQTNNCGLRTDERKLLMDMKHKIDALYEEFGKGKLEMS